MTQIYYRPLVQGGLARPEGALPLCGGPLWFNQIEMITRSGIKVTGVEDLPEDWSRRLCRPRPALAGLSMERPTIMGILNTTPDSFSDGGRHDDLDAAIAHARAMLAAGADMIDVGGESTRPGAAYIDPEEEIRRTAPVIQALHDIGARISIDTRKADVGRAAYRAGATLINDVSGFTHDPALAEVAAATALPVCVMHMRGTPGDMHLAPSYDNALLDTYDELETRIAAVEALGIPRARILADPGIGFAKTVDHNLEILNRLSLFHGLGCPLLLGVSRKRFIGTVGQTETPTDRAAGSIAVALAGIAQGVQMLRVHDVAETAQALRLWQAVQAGAWVQPAP
ncbi:dihydropteroate synthase [Pseudooceanicola sediminis]|uniref:Dihydropteroate synthase n=1 Tax=Pseudooceanicola sediminis TaxID=2211117 RepID=A0A399IXK6_9RHOB|nr:dihydropteroate synthase [Pseudooceanicola sediminis]KAA2313113.1 dihydropteroate synthase [Puniceibacterium sp. HSS470]RII37761.1 dihydropteroate synthase [Pseudooceanicola sediminis]|tara:strand:+ start:54621 stop:55643 length:1023 start_codon:yes stop_codon:yes gene_type:complete